MMEPGEQEDRVRQGGRALRDGCRAGEDRRLDTCFLISADAAYRTCERVIPCNGSELSSWLSGIIRALSIVIAGFVTT